MNIGYSSHFKKAYKKLSKKEKIQFGERLKIFMDDEYAPILKNHKLHGKYAEYRSINITSDIRLIYRKISTTEIFLYILGSHSELYT